MHNFMLGYERTEDNLSFRVVSKLKIFFSRIQHAFHALILYSMMSLIPPEPNIIITHMYKLSTFNFDCVDCLEVFLFYSLFK